MSFFSFYRAFVGLCLVSSGLCGGWYKIEKLKINNRRPFSQWFLGNRCQNDFTSYLLDNTINTFSVCGYIFYGALLGGLISATAPVSIPTIVFWYNRHSTITNQ